MIAAIFGLVGVVVGALITGGTDYLMRRREERADIRAAARLVRTELGQAEGALEVASKGESASVIPPGPFPEDEWHRYRAQFARLLTAVEWASLETAYSSIQVFNTVRDEWLKLDEMAKRIEEGKLFRRNEQAAIETLSRRAEMSFLRGLVSRTRRRVDRRSAWSPRATR